MGPPRTLTVTCILHMRKQSQTGQGAWLRSLCWGWQSRKDSVSVSQPSAHSVSSPQDLKPGNLAVNEDCELKVSGLWTGPARVGWALSCRSPSELPQSSCSASSFFLCPLSRRSWILG